MAPAHPTSAAEELRRLRLVFNSLPAMIGHWDRELRNVFANDSYSDYLGLTPEQMLGRHIRDFVGDSVFALIQPYIEGVLNGQPQVFECAAADRGGKVQHFQAFYVPDVIDGEVRGFIVQAMDVTARVQAEHAREEALRLFQLRMANAPFGEAVLTTTGQALLVNPMLCDLVGCTAEELTSSTYRDLLYPDELAAAVEDRRWPLDGEVSQISTEHRYFRPDGTTIWVQRNAVLAPGHEYGVEDVIIAQFQDVTARRVAEAQLALSALTDQLTGLSNRRALVSRIEDHQQTSGPTAPVGLIFIDLDGFKQVNDLHGHAAGDTVLAEVARRLNNAVQEPNSVYRLGGDEFVVLVPEAGDDGVADLAASVCAAMSGRYTVDADADEFHLTASVGWTWGKNENAEDLIRKADIDMYRHKARLRESAVPGS